jgi:CRISPR/Cas system CSM-associated protein Csm3 (group 7 of RAMP superfamily)
MEILIHYTITATSGILVGSSAEALSIGIDKTTMRRRKIYDGRMSVPQEPIIPGSTMKGRIRNECERILTSLLVPICRAPSADTMCPHGQGELLGRTCAVCTIFGCPTEQSRLFFSDAVARIDRNIAGNSVRVQAGVSISRRRGTAEEERLFTIERGVEGLSYSGTIDGNLDAGLAPQQTALVVAATEQLVAVGGGKSRGSGWAEVQIDEIQLGRHRSVGRHVQTVKEGLLAWNGYK